MPVAAELEVKPSLEEVRALAEGHTVVPLRHTFISDTETPSIFNSAARGTSPSRCVPGPSTRRSRSYHSRTSSFDAALSRLSIGTACRTVGRSPSTAAPTRCVGESGMTRSGNAVSISVSSRSRTSYSASEISGSLST